MNTPIVDFVKKYTGKKPIRFHMPGHKGENILGFEDRDITEINGADSLFEAKGIIKESEENASLIFNAHTFYSCEGSSLSIRATVYLARLYGLENNRQPLILASRNAHKAFLSACALTDCDILWLKNKNCTYLTAEIDLDFLENYLKNAEVLPCAVYITTPDYLGNITDLCTIAHICKKYKVLLLADNAHGAYLNFLDMHPLQQGADMVCDSAHKTLPVLTGGGYLHISKSAPVSLKENAKNALGAFASTSPSYLILQSLDKANSYFFDFGEKLKAFIPQVDNLKEVLIKNGYQLIGNEPLKLTIKTKPYGYTGFELAKILEAENIIVEFADKDYCVFMLPIDNNAIKILKEALLSIPKSEKDFPLPPVPHTPNKALTPRQAFLKSWETVETKKSLGRILHSPCVACPPAVPIIAMGEIIDENAINAFEYYGISEIKVVKENSTNLSNS